MNGFDRIDALIEKSSADGIEEVKALLLRFKGKSLSQTIDEFMLDFMTLAFLVETAAEGSQKSIRMLARTRLAKIKLLAAT